MTVVVIVVAVLGGLVLALYLTVGELVDRVSKLERKP